MKGLNKNKKGKDKKGNLITINVDLKEKGIV
jgi:hypothetical protein